jgi:hypothetical protein
MDTPKLHTLRPGARYVPFRDVPVGAAFGRDQEWRKHSTRTALHLNGRNFYFRQSDIVTYYPET